MCLYILFLAGMDLVYEYNHWYPRQEGRQYLIQGLEVGFPSGSFGQVEFLFVF